VLIREVHKHATAEAPTHLKREELERLHSATLILIAGTAEPKPTGKERSRTSDVRRRSPNGVRRVGEIA
jgi:hypothetical protein